MARPEKQIDWNRVDDLLIAGCLGTEIAAAFDVHPQTFYSRVEEKYKCSFTHYSQEKRGIGDSLIREKQFQKALGLTDSGDNTMLVWLGKNRLGQRNEDKLSIVTSEQQTTLDKTMDMVDFLQQKQHTQDVDSQENVE